MKRLSLKILLLAGLLIICMTATAFADVAPMSKYVQIPPFVLRGAAANVLLDLSIEWPTAGAAYNDEMVDANDDGDYLDVSDCDGRVTIGGKLIGKCYKTARKYIGYFDPNKCYQENSGRFEPVDSTNSDYSCTGKVGRWSGNFLNWATMSAIDELRWALTGGYRQVDTTSETVVERANVDPARFPPFHNVWQVKVLSSTYNVAPSTVTPYSDSTIYIYNHGYQFTLHTSCCSTTDYQNGNNKLAGPFYARVKVCDPTQGLEDNCIDYGGYFKPEGLMQKNADKMRFAAMGYLLDSVREREGGVLRANMKYIGPNNPDGSKNDNAEYDEDGLFIVDPDKMIPKDGDVQYSGVINYLNRFGRNGYKSKDPVSELYYECLNYYKNRGPTPNFLDGNNDYHIDGVIDPIPAAFKDGFPVISSWDDPIQYSCQKNYIIGINDAFPHVDKRLPGTAFTDADYDNDGTDDLTWGDYGEPSNPDTAYSVTALTNTVGELQGINGTEWYVGCTPSKCDWNNDLKTIPGLGLVAGPYGGSKHNSWYVAGLAYYANSEDIRPLVNDRQTITTYMMDTQEYSSTPYKGEMNMLWLTGKYGGFVEKDFLDTNGDGNPYEPNLTAEWDADADGLPDNYVQASDPEKLVSALNRAFTDILKRASSGTAASVISNTRSGEGGVYQSIFYPYFNDANCLNTDTKAVSWVGQVHALFVDAYGNMREDTNGDRTLDSLDDKIIVYDGTDIYKFIDTNANGKLDPGEFTDTNGNGRLDAAELTGTVYTMADINYIWTTNDWLNDTTLVTNLQRSPYVNDSQKRRYIFTFIDDGDMVAKADGSEQVSFDTTNKGKITPYLHPYSPFAYSPGDPPPGIASSDWNSYISTQLDRQINYIRGQDQNKDSSLPNSVIPAMRSRQVDYDCDGTLETWRMGDVVHSTPTLVGMPSEDYDLIYQDTTYRDFFVKYRKRRNVIYVGGNDGMLHAFNAGFFNTATKGFDLQTSKGEAPYPLGTELWAYIPFNLLPHLYWLTDPNYTHVPYIDLKPKVFDAKIFAADTDHPNGWGTVLVVGMRFGGGPLKTDMDRDGVPDSSGGDVQMKSAYIVLDITNPEIQPRVLAEISFDDLGYTTSYPGVVVMDPKTTSANDWYLVLGSGPTDLNSATSTEKSRIYMIDLKAMADKTTTALKDQSGTSPPAFYDEYDKNSFVSDIVSVDLDLDYKTDVVYFGIVKDFDVYKGKMRRIVIEDDLNPDHWDSDSTLFDAQKPITSAPAIGRDKDGNVWVYFGTGRFFNRADITYSDQQSFYGIKEPQSGGVLTWASVDKSKLFDSSDVVVFEGGLVMCDDGAGNMIDCATISDANSDGKDDFDELLSAVDAKKGWYLDFAQANERNLGQATLLGDILTFTTYMPDSDACEFEGFSNLYALYYRTGTAFSRSIIGLNGGNTDAEGNSEVSRQISLGKGLTVTPNIHTGKEKGSKAFIQTSTGAIEVVVQENPGATKTEKAYWMEE
jgi:Tfp pilus tip-associated adhesin PilY1